jgi:hypothetical protein
MKGKVKFATRKRKNMLLYSIQNDLHFIQVKFAIMKR